MAAVLKYPILWPDIQHAQKIRAFTWAVNKRNLPKIRMMLKEEPAIRQNSECLVDELGRAMKVGSTAVVSLLLQDGVLPDLEVAVLSGRADWIQLTLDKGFSRTQHGEFMRAESACILTHRYDLLELLASYAKAWPNHRDDKSELPDKCSISPVVSAILANDMRALLIVAPHNQLHLTNQFGCDQGGGTALFQATRKGNTEAVEYQLALGANPDLGSRRRSGC